MAEAMTKDTRSVWYNAGNRPWLLTRAPFRVAPRVYYVGNTWVGAYLIDTGDGLVLIDTTVFETTYLVLEAVRDLGYDPHDIKHILLTHCHIDHSGGVNPIKAISGAKVWQSRADTEFMRRPANLELGDDFKMMDYDVDCFYDDSQPLQFGDISIQTQLTPGHTPGTTSFFITVPDEQGGSLVVPECVKVVFLRKPEILIDHPEMFGEGVRVEEMTFIVHEEVIRDFTAPFLRLRHFYTAIGLQVPCDFGADGDHTGVSVFGRSLHDTFSRDNATGSTDR